MPLNIPIRHQRVSQATCVAGTGLHTSQAKEGRAQRNPSEGATEESGRKQTGGGGRQRLEDGEWLNYTDGTLRLIGTGSLRKIFIPEEEFQEILGDRTHEWHGHVRLNCSTRSTKAGEIVHLKPRALPQNTTDVCPEHCEADRER